MTIEYEGYTAKVELDLENDLLIGRVVGIRDAIIFHSDSVPGLRKEMKVSVDDYLDFCRERGMDPAKPYSGRFSIRMTPDSHREVAIAATADGASMNEWINEAITLRLQRRRASDERGTVKQMASIHSVSEIIFETHSVYTTFPKSTRSSQQAEWKLGTTSRMDQTWLSLEA